MDSKPVTYYTTTLHRHTELREVFGDEPVATPDDLYSVFAYMEHLDREHNVVAMFDTQKRLIGLHTASIGILDATMVGAREIFSVLIPAKAHTWAIAHNHPSGKPEPSSTDNRMTTLLAAASGIMGIPLVDHIIIGESGAYYSYRMSNPGRLKPDVTVEDSNPTRKRTGGRVVRRKAR